MDEAKDLRQTAIAVAFFIVGCAVYLAVTVPVVIELWDPMVATIGTGPIAGVMALFGTVAGAAAIRYVIHLINQWESS
jgi:hypothetical protein